MTSPDVRVDTERGRAELELRVAQARVGAIKATLGNLHGQKLIDAKLKAELDEAAADRAEQYARKRYAGWVASEVRSPW